MDVALPPEKPLVFIADDDDALCAALKDLLVDEGFAVESVSNGRQALDALRDGARPRAIIVDAMMPEMDGLTFVNELRAAPELKQVAVLIISGMPYLNLPQGVRFLQKPIDPRLLLSRLRGLINTPAA